MNRHLEEMQNNYMETLDGCGKEINIEDKYIVCLRYTPGADVEGMPENCIRLIYMMEGNATATVNGRPKKFGGNSLCIVGKNTRVALSGLRPGNKVYFMFIGDKILGPDIFNIIPEDNFFAKQIRRSILTGGTGDEMWIVENVGNNVKEAFVSLCRETNVKNKVCFKKNLIVSLALLLFHLYDYQSNFSSAKSNPKERHLTKQALILYDYLQKNVGTASLALAAEKLYLHPNYLCRLVKDLFGKTFSELFKEIKMDMATDMLEWSDDSIENISIALGYQAPGYFYRVFKEHFGITPGQFREQSKGKNGELDVLNAEESSKRLIKSNFIPAGGGLFHAGVIDKLTSSKDVFDNLSYRQGDTPNIAFLPASMEYNYIMSVGKMIADMAGGYDANVRTLAPRCEDINVQMHMLKDAIDAGSDAIILNTHDEYAAAPLIKRAWEQGIMVCMINYDNLDCPSLVHAIVGYRQRSATYHIGEYIAEKMAGKNAKVGIIQGSPSYHSNERCGGFMEAISQHKNFEVASILNGKWTQKGGYQATLDMLESDPDINLLFCANDSEAEGAVQAIKKLNRDGIIVLSNDGDLSGLKNIEAGKIVATVNTMPYEMARVALQVVMHGLRGNFKGGYVETPMSIADTTNVSNFLKQIDRKKK